MAGEQRDAPRELIDWLAARRDNCIRISHTKATEDRAGWLLDAAHFQAALDNLSGNLVDGVGLIAAERRRQVDEEVWTAGHDDEHVDGELAKAAACYALGQPVIHSGRRGGEVKLWPWDWRWWNPKDRIRDLVRAGALIAAEIDRLERLAAQEKAAQ